MKLDGKRVMVVGGSSGLGKGIALAALREGASVNIVGRSLEKLKAAVTELKSWGNVEANACDAGEEAQVKELFENTNRIDHLVITAPGDLVYKRTEDASLTEVNQVIRGKLISAFLLVKYASPKLSKDGSVVLTAGINAFIPIGRASIVSAANGALISYARALAIELKPLRFNVISPGWVDTPIWQTVTTPEGKEKMFQDAASSLPVGRVGTPEDIAGGVLMLLTNGFVTGTVLSIDGGRRLI